MLERSDRVGGKCRTFHHRGQAYELGAGAITSAYRSVGALCSEHGLRPRAGLGGSFFDGEGKQQGWLSPWLQGGLLQTGWHSARLLAALAGESRLRAPGLAGLAPGLGAPFLEWARARGVERTVPLVEPWFTGFGYGHLDEIPAAYVLKYLLLFRAPIYELVDSGYQGLWERVAARLDVRRNVVVEKITRDDAVVVTTSAGPLVFDALVVACPIDDLLAVLDVDDEERALFGAVRWNDYHVIAAEVDRPPPARYGFFAENFPRARAGEPVFFYRRFLDRPLVLYYTSPRPGASLDDSERAVARWLARGGGTMGRPVLRHAWRYFPHVESSAMRAGYYDRLEARQGQRRTWITGELLSFTAVESVVAYSQALVARHFAA